ncbi:MAG TPA: pseudouridylate synthase [Bdellovibrionales bacterium]|nr:MAG: hypothetical protein A2Z97_01515 [Bdellovibrionales bacterium GWB1_52_6]OFZ05009.1 MAG: hypothetical protein A2X97_00225 [Bdellovibrionales bacterium GWA1_52_35]OFZ35313.1 MAG: hypothetical protein A2070_10695 [Bdellovibrionales bacterium GWC1_52_8]HAR42978.1 pseudouridylate synthase [Bdellovibrionales bacterium]HCM41241.1 pseudouridylate synthase [Bdellovibrionales bacterium]
MAQQLRILYQDEQLVAVDKPAGFQVHPPENSEYSISAATNCLAILKKQLGRYLYPVHRLDRATSGALIYAFSSEAAARIQNQFQSGAVRKSYYAVVRGWTPDEGVIESPLQAEEDPTPKTALTRYRTLKRVEMNIAVGKHPTSRYSLLEVRPETGRFHQIRRHFAHISHPLIGDSAHGDGKHNRVFREKLGANALLLKAYSLQLQHPQTGSPLLICSRWGGLWHRVFDLFGVCPYQPH